MKSKGLAANVTLTIRPIKESCTSYVFVHTLALVIGFRVQGLGVVGLSAGSHPNFGFRPRV